MPLRHRIRALKRSQRALLACFVTLVVLVVLVVLTVSGVALVAPWGGGDDATACGPAPRSARTLAQDPKRAAAALDPGTDMDRTGPLAKLLRTRGAPLCAGKSGAEPSGRALVAATTGRTAQDQDQDQDKRARPHAERSARIVHGAVLVLGEAAEAADAAEGDGGNGDDEGDGRSEPPSALAPYVARVLAAYIGDVRRDTAFGRVRDWERPTASTEDARHDDGSGNWSDPFPHPGEYHAVFGPTSGASQPELKRVLRWLTLSPQAYALLYDAERAHFAQYLERLDGRGHEPVHKPRTAAEKRVAEEQRAKRKKHGGNYREDPLLGPELELGTSARFVATLAQARTAHVRDGRVPDLDAYDRAVLRHSKGGYRAAPRPVRGTPPPQGTAAQRRPDVPLGEGRRAAERLMDGRVQLFAAYDRWVRDRDVPRGTAERLRVEMDTRYGLTLRYP